ncbi:MAG TPA: hypothetical protein VFU36_15335 [Jatrophihabitans sp.]|nr:hypothetical protein [Jatrophihabitans sp.]
MYSNLTGELARVRQSDLLATAQHQRLLRAARTDRVVRIGRIRHRAAAVLVAAADRLEPVRITLDRQGVVPGIPGAAEPC